MTKPIFNNKKEKLIWEKKKLVKENLEAAKVIPLSGPIPTRTKCAPGQPYLYTDVQYLVGSRPELIAAECNTANDPIVIASYQAGKGAGPGAQVLPDGTSVKQCNPSNLADLHTTGNSWNKFPKESGGPYTLYSVPTGCDVSKTSNNTTMTTGNNTTSQIVNDPSVISISKHMCPKGFSANQNKSCVPNAESAGSSSATISCGKGYYINTNTAKCNAPPTPAIPAPGETLTLTCPDQTLDINDLRVAKYTSGARMNATRIEGDPNNTVQNNTVQNNTTSQMVNDPTAISISMNVCNSGLTFVQGKGCVTDPNSKGSSNATLTCGKGYYIEPNKGKCVADANAPGNTFILTCPDQTLTIKDLTKPYCTSGAQMQFSQSIGVPNNNSTQVSNVSGSTNIIQNAVAKNPNNIPCVLFNSGTDLSNPNLICATGFDQKYIVSMDPPNPTGPIGLKIKTTTFPLNTTTNSDNNLTLMPPIYSSPGLLVATDKDLIKYTIIPVNAAGNPTKAIPPQPSCTLVNTGTADKPSILCKEQLGNANVTMLPPIIPANCLINNSGTQTNPLITCQMFTPPEVKKATPTASTVVNTSGSQTTGVVSPIKVNDVKPGTLSSGTLLQTQRSSNPYTETIKTLNAKTNWTCPPGFVAQYPNQTLTECDASGTCTDFYQNPAVLSQPCMGSATSSFKYNKDPYGALDMNADIKCDYGFPIFSGINNNGIFNGNVMCLYQKGSGQIL